MKDKVFKIVSLVLGLPVEDVSEKLSANDVEDWDSLRHMRLILSLEEEFGISFTEEETIFMNTMNGIIRTLESRVRKD